jgi:hypothetical protein
VGGGEVSMSVVCAGGITVSIRWSSRGFRNVGYQQSDAGETPKRKHITYKFYIFLNMHLRIILVSDQLDAQISSIICLFESSTRFEQLCAHPQDDNCINTTSGIITLYVTAPPTCRTATNTVIIPEIVLIQLSSRR